MSAADVSRPAGRGFLGDSGAVRACQRFQGEDENLDGARRTYLAHGAEDLPVIGTGLLAKGTRSVAERSARSIAAMPSLLRAVALLERYREHTVVIPKAFVDNLMIAQRWAPPNGDVVECGVWRGGMIRGLADVLGRDRKYHLFDSFEGLPPAREEVDGQAAIAWQQDTADPHGNYSADEAYARGLFEGSGFDVEFHRGWFDETIPMYQPGRPISVLRLDGDWYESTMTCLRGLVPHLAPGALVLVDDYYHWDGCSRALHDYLAETKSTMRIRQSGFGTCYLINQPAAEFSYSTHLLCHPFSERGHYPDKNWYQRLHHR